MPDNITTKTLEVRQDKWSESRIVEGPMSGELAENEVILRVDRLALTANNISYAVSGDALGYWKFFPTEEGWGRIPAMGWADVLASAHPEVAVGERVWGFFPMSSHLRILAGKVRGGQFSDLSPHREGLAPVYAQFDRAASNPIYDPAREDQDSLLRGLFMTSWLVDDFLDVNNSFGAENCLITSASSKTSIALAFCVRQRGDLAAIGITSPGNVEFTESLGCYDKVITYGDVPNLDAASTAVLVDMAGSAQVLSDVHNHYNDNLKHSCRIGMTHYDEAGSVSGLPGPKPEFFFAPSHVQSRSAELGPAELMKRMGTSFFGFRMFCDNWLKVERSYGAEAVTATYMAVLTGEADPAIGRVISMQEPEEG